MELEDLLRSYLIGRHQTVCISRNSRQFRSSRTELKQGIPQGFILGPILFLIYANDLAGGLKADRVCQFADDKSVLHMSNSVAGLSQRCTESAGRMKQWCNNNDLILNINKTDLILFSKGANWVESLLVWIDNRSILTSEHVKFLGMHLDASLNWEHHIRQLAAKLCGPYGVVRRLKDVITLESIKLNYFGQIQSIISYGICFWGSSSSAYRIFSIQNRIIRCIFHLHPRTSCRPYFVKYAMLTVPSLYFRSLIILVRNNQKIFIQNRQCYGDDMVMTTRGRIDLKVPLHNSTFYEKGPYYKALMAYRMLPDKIKKCNSMGSFKRHLKQWLN